MNPPFAYLADPAHATAAFWVLLGSGVVLVLALVKLAELVRSGWRLVCRVVAPWLRRLAVAYLARTGDTALVSGAPVGEERPESLVPVEPADVLAAEPFDGGAPWFDPDLDVATVSEVFGPAHPGWLMPHRDPDSHVPADVLPEPVEPPGVDLFGGPPSPAEVAETARYAVVLAIRFTREAAQGGAQ